MRLRLLIAGLAVAACSGANPAPTFAPNAVQPNDNRKPAGTLAGGVLTIKLEARKGQWQPEGTAGKSLDVAAFAEAGGPMLTPGPLIRVPVGTEVRATVKNTLDRSLNVSGFGEKRGFADTAAIAAGAEKELHFKATTPGTYYYYARSTTKGALDTRLNDESQLHGAIIVDSAGAVPSDRVFVISWWFIADSTSPTGLKQSTMTINGLSWPHTEHLTYPQGDTVQWRVINVTESDHPMHLHGFYFQMRAKGNGISDSIYNADQRRLGVTEIINPMETMDLAWLPTRTGNWIYHCHFAGHLSDLASLDHDGAKMDSMPMMSQHSSDRPHQMFGLVLGITVTPKGPQVADTREPRPIRLEIREKPNVYGDKAGYAFVLAGTKEADDPDALNVPGPALLMKRGERVAVTVVNHAKDRAAVHWHGIELESFPDGVPGWSGQGKEILPSVAPNDSITVKFTVPRAGTFMYHSHFNESHQITGGLYGPIIVLDSAEMFNPETDRVMIFSSGGTPTNVITGPYNLLLNGKANPAPIELKSGTTYRFRMIDISDDFPTIVSLTDGKKPVEWHAYAKDGATLPASQAVMKPATLLFDPGEVYDFHFTPKAPGKLALTFGGPPAPPEFGLPRNVTVPVIVK